MLVQARSLFAAALLAVSALARGAAPDPAELVRRADNYRQVYDAAVMAVRLTRFEGQERLRDSQLKVAIQGTEKSLIRVVEGADAGQQMLMTGEGLWIKLPRSTRTVRITPMQRLLGEASVGDIGRLRWHDDYAVRYAQPEEGIEGETPCWHLELTARSELATYPRILVSVAKADARPLKAQFFLKSSKAIKSVEFGPLEKINDRQGIRRMVFRDMIKTENRTEMVLEKVSPRALEPRLYALETLGEWQ